MGNAFMRHWWKVGLVVWIILMSAVYWFLRPYHPNSESLQAFQNTADVTVADHNHVLVFEPAAAKQPSVIFYPGGLVEPKSYAPLAQKLAQAGHRTYIVKMPVNLAIFGGDRAAELIRHRALGETFVIGGHSLGGVMASRFAAAHPQDILGVFFLASYPDSQGSLASSDIPVLSLIGSKDGAVDPEVFAKAKAYLPASAEFHTLEGGNHSQFGSYGLQKGDWPASTSPGEQLDETVKLMLDWMDQHVPDNK